MARIRRGSLSSVPIQICRKTSLLAQATMSVLVPPTTPEGPTMNASMAPSVKTAYGIGHQKIGERKEDRRVLVGRRSIASTVGGASATAARFSAGAKAIIVLPS